jgi:hypothetical protein
VAAVVATAGDLGLLWAANAARPELGLPPPPAGVLLAGYYAGAFAVPLYVLGYWQLSRRLVPAGPTLARAVYLLGTAGSIVGGILHALTGFVIRYEGSSGLSGADPMVIVLRYGMFLVPLWGLIVGTTVAGSALYALAVQRGGTAYPRWMAAVNPFVLEGILLLVARVTSPVVAAFLVPATPNVAHVVFFAASVAAARRA